MSNRVASINPANDEVVAEYDLDAADAVESAIELADQRHRDWRRTPFATRSTMMEAAAGELERRRDELATLMALEMGKPLAQGRAEVDKCAWVCRYYAEHAEGQLADVAIPTERSQSYLHYEPLGAVLAVMPWNFPLWQVFRFAAPALMAGNAGLLKHASNVTGSALAIQQIFEAAGAPEGLFRTLVIPSSRVADVIRHPLVRAVTLTGSEHAGRSVASVAGEVLKKSVLELGGSDPYIVLADADLPTAAAICAQSRLINSGQSCIAAKRFIVDDAVHDEFVPLFVDEIAARTMGDPLADGVDVGPQARTDLRDELHQQVETSIAQGARVELGCVRPDGPGAFYPPSVLSGVEIGMVAADEELFGPVAAVLRASDVDDAVRIANASPFGLGAAIFTGDEERGRRIAAEQLDAGCCFVNALVASDPRLPFGGIKLSGYGRELSDLGIKEFMNAKTVVVA
jgi:succinate-semialdehyde dehydrogenase/glutarate-semialdehyde dehydrogenase